MRYFPESLLNSEVKHLYVKGIDAMPVVIGSSDVGSLCLDTDQGIFLLASEYKEMPHEGDIQSWVMAEKLDQIPPEYDTEYVVEQPCQIRRFLREFDGKSIDGIELKQGEHYLYIFASENLIVTGSNTMQDDSSAVCFGYYPFEIRP